MKRFSIFFFALVLNAAANAFPLIIARSDNYNNKILERSGDSLNTPARQFDFWVGEWDVFGVNNKEAGKSRIEKILKGAVIFENWTGKSGYVGKSFNHYDHKINKWFQYWIDEKSDVISFEGNYDPVQKAMVFFSYDHEKDSENPYIRRLRFFDIDPDNVRQFSEQSSDGGKTWKTEYDLYYKRKK